MREKFGYLGTYLADDLVPISDYMERVEDVRGLWQECLESEGLKMHVGKNRDDSEQEMRWI